MQTFPFNISEITERELPSGILKLLKLLVDQCLIEMRDVSETHYERLGYITLFLRPASKIIIDLRFTIELLFLLSFGYQYYHISYKFLHL